MNIGLLHPGDMGSSVGYSMAQAGNRVYWLPDDRSQRTTQRAAKAGLQSLPNLDEMAEKCQLIVSVCPPAFSESVAQQVRDTGFDGLLLEANAISPQRSQKIAEGFDTSKADYLDGGLVGSPAWQAGTTTLYLSGARANELCKPLNGGTLAVRVLGPEIGTASAMKMCFAAYTKGSKALIAAIMGTAEYYGVSDALTRQWGQEVTDQRIAELQRIAGRAWRWEDEMQQIADTLAQAGMPDGSHRAAAEIYRRLAGFRDCEQPPEWQSLLEALRQDH